MCLLWCGFLPAHDLSTAVLYSRSCALSFPDMCICVILMSSLWHPGIKRFFVAEMLTLHVAWNPLTPCQYDSLPPNPTHCNPIASNQSPPPHPPARFCCPRAFLRTRSSSSASLRPLKESSNSAAGACFGRQRVGSVIVGWLGGWVGGGLGWAAYEVGMRLLCRQA